MLRKLMSEFPHCFWNDLLPKVKIGLRHLVSLTHGYRPCEVLFKQQIPHLGGTPLGLTRDISLDEVEAVVDALMRD